VDNSPDKYKGLTKPRVDKTKKMKVIGREIETCDGSVNNSSVLQFN
jgi:hypothetical protein